MRSASKRPPARSTKAAGARISPEGSGSTATVALAVPPWSGRSSGFDSARNFIPAGFHAARRITFPRPPCGNKLPVMLAPSRAGEARECEATGWWVF